MEKPIEILLYTDGSTKTNPGLGSWAAVILKDGKEEILTKAYKHTTNNRMEMLAVIEPLHHIKNSNMWTSAERARVHIFSDSRYVINSITKYMPTWKHNGWRTSRGASAKNIDLLQMVDKLMEGMDLIFTWVKGHSDNKYNNRCDVLARDALASTEVHPDTGYELDKKDNLLYNLNHARSKL